MARNRRNNALRIIAAAAAGLGYFNTEGDKGGGGDGGKPPEKKPDAPAKLELTAEELQQKIDAAIAQTKSDAEASAKKAREEAAAAEAKKKGEFEELYKGETARVKELEEANRKLRTETAVRDHLAEKHAEYVGVAKYIIPQIPADTKESELPKAIERAAADYVKDNPRKGTGGGGAPSAPPRTPGRGTSNGNQQPVRARAGAADNF